MFETIATKTTGLALLIVVLTGAAVRGDAIVLANGDRLTGTIQELAGGALSVETPYGKVSIAQDQLQSIASPDSFRVEFTSGQTATGALSSPEPGMLQVGSGPPVPILDVASIGREIPEPGPLGNWHGSVDFGYTLNRGNTEIDNLFFNVRPELRREIDRFVIRFQSLYSMQADVTTSNMHAGQIRYDRFFSPRTFFFIIGRAETDELERLDLRTSEGGGFGVRFQPGPNTSWSIFGGLSFLQEDFETLDRQLSAEGLAGLEFETSVWGPAVFNTRGEFLPILTDGRFRLEGAAGLRGTLIGSLNAGIQLFNKLDSDPPVPGIKKNDFGLVSTLGFSF